MSISPVSAPTSIAAPPPPPDTNSHVFRQLAKSITDGDLTSAQNAVAKLTAAQVVAGQTPANPLGKLVTSLNSALSAGDIASAQSTLVAFQQDHSRNHPTSIGPAGAASPSLLAGSTFV